MRLAFKRRFGFGYVERDVPVTLNIGTLEAVCKALKIEFWQIGETLKKDNFDFVTELLYQGYVSACKDRYRRPKYGREKAVIWKEYMSQSAQREFTDMMTALFGEITKSGIKKKRQADQVDVA